MTSADAPSFNEFLQLKSELLASRPAALDCTETRMAQVLQPHLANPQSLGLAPAGYRCHVAKDWLTHFGLPDAFKPRVLVSQGVRHSLQVLFAHYAQAGKRLLLPSDVYPVYQDLANQSGATWQGYEAWSAFDKAPAADADVLLLTNPLKPKGELLSPPGARQVIHWLLADPRRRVLVDAVYTFERQLDPMTRWLYDHGQAVVLHSLSKGWAQPLAAGVALVPEQDVEQLTNVFRGLAVDRERLSLAEALLARDGSRPALLAHVLAQKAKALGRQLTQSGAPLPPGLKNPLPGQYLFALEEAWRTLWDRHRVLALPLSVFGSSRTGCVLSSLGARP